MNHRTMYCTFATSLLLAALPMPAAAQTAKSVVGTYALVSSGAFGENPRGEMTLSPNGRYSAILARTTLPKVAAGARDKGTGDENKAIVGGSIAHFGKYTVDPKDKTITFNIETSTYPNWDGTAQKRPLKISGDTLTYTVTAPSAGGQANDVVWKRIK
jgi:hypothetical protein